MYTTEFQKEQFLKEYFRSRVVSETMCNAIMNRAITNERKFKKPFYDYSKDEIMQMYTEAKVKSGRTLQNWNLTLKHAARWFLNQQNKPLDNQYEHITREDVNACIDSELIKQLLISRDDLNTMQDDLMNATDRAILEMLFLGFGEESLKELTFFTLSDLGSRDKTVYCQYGKVILLDERSYDIIKQGCEEDSLISFGTEMRLVKVSIGGIYKARGNTVNENDDPNNEDDVRRRFRWVHRRVNLVSDYLGVPMTPKSLNASGFWHFSHLDMKEKGIEDFREYIHTENGKRLCWRFGFRGENYTTTVLDKFRRYL